MKRLKERLISAVLLTVAILSLSITAAAAYMDISDNEYIETKNTSTGKTGKNMTISFVFRNVSDRDLKNIKIGLSEDVDISDDAYENSDYRFPFEVTADTFDTKNFGSIEKGKTKSVTLNAKVRRDISEGYYGVPVKISADDFAVADEYVNVWITKSSSSGSDEEESDSSISFILGENQQTPFGTYPEVMNFDVNVRNEGTVTAQDVTVSMVPSKDTLEFPFEINDANYDRKFDTIQNNETVSANYSMAIREDAYTGYYPVKFNITYRDSSEGAIQTLETTYFVRIKNKEKESDGEFDVNTSTKARIIVDGFKTEPEEVFAGQTFELILHMKNASANIPASNILFSLEPEKTSDNGSAVFSTENGSSSVVVNELGAGQSTDVRFLMSAKAGIDQRSYAITIKEQYDSPEFKNASETVSIDIPVKQVARLNTGTIEVMPDSISTGSETNVMFSINNTGKVALYNVMAAFEADSINPVETYVGNIKPGETGNVDVMITGAAPTADDGKVKIVISYEDENGEATTIEKEMMLFVTEELPVYDEMIPNEFDQEVMAEQTFFEKNKIVIAILAALVSCIAVFAIIKRRKKKKQKEAEDDIDIETEEETGADDEIS